MKIENNNKNNQMTLSKLKPGTPFVFVVDGKVDYSNLALLTDDDRYVYLSTGYTFYIDSDARNKFVIPVVNAKIVFD